MDAEHGRDVFFLMGPTASGKTELALTLAQTLPVEIVSVDSGMVYRGLDIGTAKPGAAVRARVAHHLIDICDPAESYSAGRFRNDAVLAVDAILARGALPLLVGGTGLYFRALERGIAPLPPASAVVRAELDRAAREIGWEGMHARLAALDPPAAARIHPNDPQRIQRALEVHELTGKTLTHLCAEAPATQLPYRVHKLVIAPGDRAVLHARIRARFLAMLERGFVEEVRALRARADLGPDRPAMRLVGYRQVRAWLDGQGSREEMIERAVAATRQLARRQLTWLRAESGTRQFDSEGRNLAGNVLNFMQQNGAKPVRV